VGAVLNNYQKVQEIEKSRLEVSSGEVEVSDERLRALVDELDRVLKARAVVGAEDVKKAP
jgi:hypothetical protein